MGDLTAQQAIANLLHDVEDEGVNDADAMALADDVLHALRVAGYAAVSTTDLSNALIGGVCEPEEAAQAHGRLLEAIRGRSRKDLK